MTRVNILNACIDNLTKQELLEKLTQQGGIVVTPNVDHLMILQKDPEFHKVYQLSTYRVCDSKIIFLASKFLGKPIQEKISGADLFPEFYHHNKDNDKIKIFLLGAGEGVAKQAQEKINKKVGREIIVNSYSPPFGFEKDEEECQKIIDLIDKSGATVLAIGVGSPKQEKWIIKYKDQLKTIKIFLAIGATIDFEAGNKPRAPKWISELGFEWLYRLIYEPRRLWKRYLVEDMPFLWLVFKQKFNLYKPPAWSNVDLVSQEKLIYTELKKPIGRVLQ
jgi:N-acetylglucosaminyldiphosphoundecaprenol N-acetyl-beta-D-mannosaminyltransferase